MEEKERITMKWDDNGNVFVVVAAATVQYCSVCPCHSRTHLFSRRLLTLSRTRLKLLLLSIADCQTQSLLANHQLYLILPPPVKETNRQTDRHIKSALLIRAEKEKTDHSVVIGRNENDDNNNNSGNQWTVVSFRTLWVNHHKGQNRGATNCDSSGNFKRERERASVVVKVVKVVIQWYHSATAAAAAVVNLLVQANTLLYFTLLYFCWSLFFSISHPLFHSITYRFTEMLLLLLPLPQWLAAINFHLSMAMPTHSSGEVPEK